MEPAAPVASERAPRHALAWAGTTTARARRTVLTVALVVLALKVVMAATTYGTRDINHWRDFVTAVAGHGPVGIYGVHFDASFYNHPPLVGYLLELIRIGVEHGLSIQFTLRTLTSLADVGSALLVFELLARRRPRREAVLGGAWVAASPVLFVISGFHGNTDPLFMALALLALHLLADRDRPAAAGVALALALGIKIVPVVIVPALIVLAVHRGRRVAAAFLGGFALALLATWSPALLSHGHEIRTNVFGYAGSNVSQWGLTQLGHWAGDPLWARYLVGDGRFPVVLLCAGLPALLVWQRPELVAEGVALALVAFLFLSPAFGTQYLVWALAPAYLVRSRFATVFNLAAGALLIEVYTRWDGGLPWDFAREWGFDRGETVAGVAVWAALGAVLVGGAIDVTRRVGSTPGR